MHLVVTVIVGTRSWIRSQVGIAVPYAKATPKDADMPEHASAAERGQHNTRAVTSEFARAVAVHISGGRPCLA